jgi:Acyl-CoA synthetases (AMP-forming)/AMP-acid ligases II
MHGDTDLSPSIPFPAERRGLTYANRLEQFGSAVALVSEKGDSVTYAELAKRADEFAAGLGSERRLLLIEAENEIEAIVAYLGALRHRHPVLLAAGENSQLLDRILTTYEPDLRYRKHNDEWRLENTLRDPRHFHPDLALLLSTSGSTGAAKLVRLSYEAIDANALSISEYLGLRSEDRPITTLPIHYSYGLSVVTSHLSVGATLLLTGRSVIDADFWKFFETNNATSIAGVPYTYEMLERTGFRQKVPASLRTMTQAGGRLSPELAAKYAECARKHGVQFFVMYGQTEATARMAYMPPELLTAYPDCIGIPIPGGSFRLIDGAGAEIHEIETPGELVYSGPNIMLGYALEQSDLAKGRELNELRTGDLAIRNGEGLYKIVGRKSRFLKLFGLRISLDEVENFLAGSEIRALATGDDSLLAICLLSGEQPDEVAQLLSKQLSLPSTSIRVSHYSNAPTLSSGKFDYQTILRDAKAISAQDNARRPERLTTLFEHTFPDQKVSPADTFISLGGDSLTYVRLSLELEEKLGFLPAGWEETPIDELEALASAPKAPKRWWDLRNMESEIIIRATAIVAVVINHASSLTVGGGAHVLLMLSGYNFSKYQRSHLTHGEGWATLWSFTKRIIAPYYAILISYFLLTEKFDLSSLLLVSNFFGRSGNFLEPYWFLEVLFQITFLFITISSIAPVRRAIARDPWIFGLIMLSVALITKLATFSIFHHHGLQNRTPDAVFYLFAFGWCLHQAQSSARKILLTLLASGILVLDLAGPIALWDRFAYPADVSHALWLAVSTGLLLWAPQLSVPNWAHGVIAMIAAASFYIYLTHGVPVHFLIYGMGWNSLAITLPISIAVGLATHWLIDRISRRRQVGLARVA